MNEDPVHLPDGIEAANVARKGHLKGFVFGLATYVLVWSLKTDDTAKMTLWLFLAGGLAWWYTANHGRWVDSTWGLRKLLGLLGLIAAGFIGLLIADAIIASPAPASTASLSAWSGQRMVYVLVAVPLIEELLFRGFLFESIGTVIPAVLLTAAADSIAHGIGRSDMMYALALLPGSLILGGIRAYAKGVTVPLVIHVCINVLAYGSP